MNLSDTSDSNKMNISNKWIILQWTEQYRSSISVAGRLAAAVRSLRCCCVAIICGDIVQWIRREDRQDTLDVLATCHLRNPFIIYNIQCRSWMHFLAYLYFYWTVEITSYSNIEEEEEDGRTKTTFLMGIWLKQIKCCSKSVHWARGCAFEHTDESQWIWFLFLELSLCDGKEQMKYIVY